MTDEFETLLAALDAPDADTRSGALDAIGQWDATHDTPGLTAGAVGRVAARLHDPERGVRWAAAYALGAMGHDAGAAPLLDALTAAEAAGDGGLQLVIVKALGKIGGDAVRPVLASLAAEGDSRCIRAAAARAITRPPV